MKKIGILAIVALLPSISSATASQVVTLTGRPDLAVSPVQKIFAGEVDVLKKTAYEADSATLHYSSLEKSGVSSAVNIPLFAGNGSTSFGELIDVIEVAQSMGRVIFVAARGAAGDNESVCAQMKKHPQNAYVLPAGGSGNFSLDPLKEPSCFSPNILVVAAANGKQLASFSSYGPGVRIAAQGFKLRLEGLGGEIRTVSGTTYPSAMVAGRLAVFAEPSRLNGGDLVSKFLEEETEISPALGGRVAGNRLLKNE